jgi:hypothetical protein
MGNLSYYILIKQEIGLLYLASNVNTVTGRLRTSAHWAKTGIEIRVSKRNTHSFRNFHRTTKM